MSKKAATATKRAAAKRGVLFNRESVPLKLSGWAAPAEASSANDELSLSLVAGSVRLGRLRRDRKRPDVDEFLGYEGPPAGFRIDDFGLAAFAEITGFTDFAIEVLQTGGSSTRHPLTLGDGGTAAAEPLGCRREIRKSVRLADLWLESSRKLTLRFEGAGGAARRVDAYQCLPGAAPMLIEIGPDRPVGGAISTVTFTLPNPFLPLLLIFSGEDGAIDAIDVLPFPSLVRGGRHAAERMIAGHGGDDVSDTASLSAELLRGLRLRRQDARGYVSDIEFDLAMTTGQEPGLDEDVLVWLGDSLGLRLGFDASGEAIPPFIVRRVAARSSGGGGRHTLQLPADAIPTIAALVNPYPPAAGGQVVYGGFAVVDWHRHGHIWSVWEPPVGAWLEGLQFGSAVRFAPALRFTGEAVEEDVDHPPAPGWPLAVVFREQPTKIHNTMPFETSADLPLPLLRGGGMPGTDPLCAVVLFDERRSSPVPLLESLARQQSVGPIDVTVCWPAGEDSVFVRKALQTLFPDAHQLFEQPRRWTILEQLVAAREALKCSELLIVRRDTVLVDPRTLATLLPMLAAPEVLSAGCLIRSAEDKAAEPAGAGYSITGLDLCGTPALAFEQIDPGYLRQPATFPVIANSVAAMVAKKGLLDGIEPSGSVPFRPEADELMLGVHGIESGGMNLCTTIVSAYAAMRPAKRGRRPATLPYRLSAETVSRIAESATLVQRIR